MVAKTAGRALLFTFFSLGLSAQTTALSFRPVAAEFSSSLNRIIMISESPNLLHIYSPDSGTDTTVSLAMAPLSLSVSPDGLHAAVGHDAQISYVNLSSATVTRVYPVTMTVEKIVLGPAYVYAISGSVASYSINLSTGAATATWAVSSCSRPRLNPAGTAIYCIRTGSPSDIQHVDVSTGLITTQTDSPYHGDYSFCGGIWFSPDGKRVYDGCATIVQSSSDSSLDMTYVSSFSDFSSLNSLSQSAVSSHIALIPKWSSYYYPTETTDTDTEIRLFDSAYLRYEGRLVLPTFPGPTANVTSHGRWVFHSADGTLLYAVIQADTSAGIAYDYAVHIVRLASPLACSPQFAASSATATGDGIIQTVGITADAGCLYTATTSSAWIDLLSGYYGSGSGTLSYHVRPNHTASSRTGAITLGSQTFTITQPAAAATAGFRPVSYSVLATGYSKALDRLVTISTSPAALHIVNPATLDEQMVSLVLKPLSVSVRPDGLQAAVGHDGWISIVDLQTAAVVKIIPIITDVAHILLAANGYAYAFPAREWSDIYSVLVSTGTVTATSAIYDGRIPFLLPNTNYVYLTSSGWTSKKTIASGIIASATGSAPSSCGHYWSTEAGDRLITACATLYRSSSITTEDGEYSGTLSGAGTLRGAAASDTRRTLAVIPGFSGATATDGLSLWLYGYDYLALSGQLPLTQLTVNSASVATRGQYLTWNSDASKLYVVSKADSSAGLTSDSAVQVITANDSATCSISVPSGGGVGSGITYSSFAVTTGSACMWLASSNVPWITITAGGAGLGSGPVSFTVAANASTSSRQGLITVGSSTYTVTQAGLTYSISGTVTRGGAAVAGVTVSLTGSATASTATDSSGRYSFSGLAPGGSFVVTAVRSSIYNFNPGTWAFASLAADQTADFTAVARTPSAVFRNATGSIELIRSGATTLYNAGGIFASNPSASQNSSGNTFVVARDTYNAIWANVFDNSTSSWGSWGYGGGATQGKPAIAVAANGTAYIAVRDSWNSYWITSYTAGSGFGSWTYLAGIFSTDPVMTACSDGSVYVVGRDSWRSLWSARYVPSTATFQGWKFGGGIIQGSPSITCGTDNVVYMAVRDDWNSLWMARISGDNWLGWSYGGGIMNGDPFAVATGSGTVQTVIRDSGGVVWSLGYTEGTSAGWLNWVMTGGVLQDFSPAGNVGDLYITGRDGNNTLWWYQASSSQWTAAGNAGVAAGPLTAAP